MQIWLRRIWRVFGALYVMFFGAGDRWSVWVVVMAILGGLYIGAVTEGFSAPPSLGQLVFLAVFVGISALGVYIRRKRKEDQ